MCAGEVIGDRHWHSLCRGEGRKRGETHRPLCVRLFDCYSTLFSLEVTKLSAHTAWNHTDRVYVLSSYYSIDSYGHIYIWSRVECGGSVQGLVPKSSIQAPLHAFKTKRQTRMKRRAWISLLLPSVRFGGEYYFICLSGLVRMQQATIVLAGCRQCYKQGQHVKIITSGISPALALLERACTGKNVAHASPI